MAKEYAIKKPLKDLRLKEELECVYAYNDTIKQEFQPFYNDEIPLPLNFLKLFQKAAPNFPIQKKKFYDYFEDISVIYKKEEDPLNLIISFEVK